MVDGRININGNSVLLQYYKQKNISINRPVTLVKRIWNILAKRSIRPSTICFFFLWIYMLDLSNIALIMFPFSIYICGYKESSHKSNNTSNFFLPYHVFHSNFFFSPCIFKAYVFNTQYKFSFCLNPLCIMLLVVFIAIRFF